MGELNDCCKNEEKNLIVQPQDRTDLLIRKCRVCGCRHFKLWAEKGVLGARMSQLGKKKKP